LTTTMSTLSALGGKAKTNLLLPLIRARPLLLALLEAPNKLPLLREFDNELRGEGVAQRGGRMLIGIRTSRWV